MIRREYSLWLECDAPEPRCSERAVVTGTDKRDAEKQARWLGWRLVGGACLCPTCDGKFPAVTVRVA